MNIEIKKCNGLQFAVVRSKELLIKDSQSALDLLVAVKMAHQCQGFCINKEAIDETFFDLRTGVAGEVVQKFVNYQMKMAVIGTYSQYTSKSLQDFIYECNNGRHIFFVPSVDEGLNMMEKL